MSSETEKAEVSVILKVQFARLQRNPFQAMHILVYLRMEPCTDSATVTDRSTPIASPQLACLREFIGHFASRAWQQGCAATMTMATLKATNILLQRKEAQMTGLHIHTSFPGRKCINASFRLRKLESWLAKWVYSVPSCLTGRVPQNRLTRKFPSGSCTDCPLAFWSIEHWLAGPMFEPFSCQTVSSCALSDQFGRGILFSSLNCCRSLLVNSGLPVSPFHSPTTHTVLPLHMQTKMLLEILSPWHGKY